MRELVVFPALRRGFDGLFAAGHEVPEDEAPAVGRIPSEQHHTRRRSGRQRHRLTGRQYDEVFGWQGFAVERDAAVDRVDAALGMLGRNLEARAGFQFDRHVQRAAEYLDR
ncbi:hypothetical protein AWV80_09440 [Cupriavidus sp. UYMU48A]|nr:hypothetical protein AWV80_09440 [Cupriavidus sp. UYMU48A]